MNARRKARYFYLLLLKHDLPAGLSVFLVALPLCLGIALASGAPAYAGIISGIIGGMIVSVISGSNLGVSGPAAGLASIVALSIGNLGYQTFLVAVILAGAFQLILGLLRLGTIANYFPSSVIKGMLAAIGIMLVSKQIPIVLLGYAKSDFWTDSFLSLFQGHEFKSNFANFTGELNYPILLFSVLSIGLIVLWKYPPLNRLKMIPVPLLVVLLGIGYSTSIHYLSPSLKLDPRCLVDVPLNIFAEFKFPDFSTIFSNSRIWNDAFVIGLLASLETLLCVEAIDKLDRYNRVTPINRELVAQGIGNMLCGVAGAIPMTAVIVRGAANVDAGGRTWRSSFIHGLLLLVAVLSIPFVLDLIPRAALSAILIVTGYNLAKPKLFKNMYSLGWKQFLPFVITIFTILATDLLKGVSIGLLISIYFIIQNNFRSTLRLIHERKHETDYYFLKLHTNVSFLNKVNIKKALDKIPPYSVVEIDGTGSMFIDYDILEIISAFELKAQQRHIQLELKGIERVSVTDVH